MRHGPWLEHAERRLAEEGHRAGGARHEVMRQLSSQACCRTAQQIHDELRAGSSTVGLASVYRALETLSGLGLVHRVDVDGVAAYEPAEPSGEHHHHVVCSSCGRVDTFEDDALERAIELVSSRLGYAVRGHDVLLRGDCRACAA